DQVENLFKHEIDQIGLTESYFKLFSDVQKLQHEFGKKLRKTVSVYLPRKKPDVDELSSVLTYSSIVPQILEMGVTHEASSKKLNESVVNPLKTQVENEKRSLEKQRSHWSKLNATIEQSRKQLELSWQKYVTNFKERQKAYEVSEKAQNDIQLARVDQQKNTDLTIRQVADRIKVLRDLVMKTDNELRSTDRMIESCRTNPKFGDMECLVRAGATYSRRLNSLKQHIKELEVKFNNLGGDLAYTKAESIAEKLSSRAVINNNTNTSKVRSVNTKSLDDDEDDDDDESDHSFDSDADVATNNSKDDSTVNSSSDLHAGTRYVGYASALYEYEGDGSTYLATKPGELYYVLKVDSTNSGWTAVVSEDGTRQGFVPTGYINLTLY
ncbi:hypothetical protein MS3_00001809, partial [Schistosoma haematobium]